MADLSTLRVAYERLRQPDYTGRNRCWPCTAVNLVIVALIGGVLTRRNTPLGLFSTAVGCLLVALRGYVVPGTPRFAPALIAPLPVDFAHGDDRVEPGTLGEDADPEALMGALLEAGVLEATGEDLHLDREFRDAWESRMADLRALPGEELADRAGAASGDDVEGQYHGERVLLAGGRDVWLTPAIAIAETAAAETLAEWSVPASLRAPAAEPLRTFLRRCPACGGDVAETTVRNCCGGPGGLYREPEQPVLACEACETVVFEFDEPVKDA